MWIGNYDKFVLSYEKIQFRIEKLHLYIGKVFFMLEARQFAIFTPYEKIPIFKFQNRKLHFAHRSKSCGLHSLWNGGRMEFQNGP